MKNNCVKLTGIGKTIRRGLAMSAIVLILNVGTGVFAQGTRGFAARLAQPDPAHHSRVVVTEYGDAGEIVRSLEASRTPGRINGYRVRIFYDNSQNAREMAMQTNARFKALFPGIPSYMTYENPYFKVSVGNCFTNEEAITLWGKVKGAFDKAFVTVESIPVSEFTE